MINLGLQLVILGLVLVNAWYYQRSFRATDRRLYAMNQRLDLLDERTSPPAPTFNPPADNAQWAEHARSYLTGTDGALTASRIVSAYLAGEPIDGRYQQALGDMLGMVGAPPERIVVSEHMRLPRL